MRVRADFRSSVFKLEERRPYMLQYDVGGPYRRLQSLRPTVNRCRLTTGRGAAEGLKARVARIVLSSETLTQRVRPLRAWVKPWVKCPKGVLIVDPAKCGHTGR
jgi:hypothetical protein